MINEALLSRHALRLRGSLTLLLAVWLHAGLYAQPNTWAQMASYGGGGRNAAVGFSIGTKGYIGTGSWGPDFTRDFWEYDPVSNTWSQKADFGGAGRNRAVGFSIGAKGYVGTGEVGVGVFVRDLWEYDPATNVWTQKADFGGSARSRAVGFSIGSKGYLGFGNDGAYPNDLWEYDPTLDTWTPKASLGASGREGAVAFRIGSKGYVGTGFNGGYLNDLWEYDPAANSWASKAAMPGAGRWLGVSFAFGNRGFIGSGITPTYVADFWEYTATTNSWDQVAALPGGGRAGATAFSVGNTGFVGTGSVLGGFPSGNLWAYTPAVEMSLSCSVQGPLCNSGTAPFYVSYTATGAFTSGNLFTAQLSNASGSFAAPVVIGSVGSTTSGLIFCIVPSGTAIGSGYRIRVVGSAPNFTGSDNGVNLTMVAPTGVSCPADLSVCSTIIGLDLQQLPGLSPPPLNASSSFSGPGVTAFNVYQGQWNFNPAIAGVGTHTITYTYNNGSCPGSCTFAITVDPPTSNTTTITACGSYTWALTGQTYTASGNYAVYTADCITEELALTILPPPVVSCPADLHVCSTVNALLLEELPGLSPPSNSAASSFSGPGVSVWDAALGLWDFFPGSAGVGTHTITYTYDDGGCSSSCTFDITVDPLTNNTTTITACDSYTWAVTGQTYTASGNYQGPTTNCVTEQLALTILPAPVVSCPADLNVCSTVSALILEELPGLSPPSNSAASSFSGPGVFEYDASLGQWDFLVLNAGVGTHTITYTYDNGGCASSCDFEITVDPVITDTTTVTVCGSYTWAVTGQNYTNSGLYLAGGVCTTFVLDLTILDEAECDPCPLAVDGIPNFDENTCACELGYFATFTDIGGNDVITACTICPTGSFCADGLESTPCAINTYNPVAGQTECLACPNGQTSGVGATACVPDGPCIDVTLEINTDLSASQTTWEIVDAANSNVLCSGGPYADGSQLNITENCCLPEGCHVLRMFDSAGDGMMNGSNGGYQLRLASDNRRIIDNQGNGDFGSMSEITGNAYSFCLPIGDVEPLFTSCDKYWWRTGEYMVATPDAAVSAEWLVGAPNTAQSTTSGYEFWFYNPNGGYSFRRFRNHRTSDGFGPASAVRACHMKVNNWAVANHIPEFDLMNVRIRPVINGVNGDWGPACRFTRNEALALCPPTKLMDIPGNQFLSCGQFRQFGVPGQRIHSRPVAQATQYEWRFRIPAENTEIIRSSNSYFLNLNWGPGIAAPLEAGKTYEVDVRAFRNGAWCVDPVNADEAWGDICLLTMQNPPAQGGNQNLALVGDGEFSLWPNPNRGDQFWISFASLGGTVDVETIAVDIHDLTGKRVVAREIPVNDRSGIHTVIDLNGDLANGVYLVSIIAGDKRYTERLVIAN